MNTKARQFIKNFSYTLSSNIIRLLISTLVILIVPKLISVEAYGYWQLYLFYSSYVGFFHLGWNDGIYLKYGGKNYNELDKKLFHSQFYLLFIFQLIISVTLVLYSTHFVQNNSRSFILTMIAINVVFINLNTMLLYVLQATNRFKEYSISNISGRVTYFILMSILLFIGIRDFRILVLADIIGIFISLLVSMLSCKNIIINKASDFSIAIKEAFDNINIGIKLMLSNIAGMLIIGVIRFGIEKTWDVATFGKVSLTFSISNLMMIFINAVGVIIYPVLRRTNEEKLSGIYLMLREFIVVILLGILILYYPLKVGVSLWLPKYVDSLKYMAILFPIFIYEGKMALLINTYMKALRKEKLMLLINSLSLFISLILTLISTWILKHLDLAILTIIIVLAFRSVIAELFLGKHLKIKIYKLIILELILTIIFTLSSWNIDSVVASVIYACSYLIYLFIQRKSIFISLNQIREMIKTREV